jgi:hypothetical protein
MSKISVRDDIKGALIEEFGKQAWLDFKSKWGDAAANRVAAIGTQILTLRERRAPKVEARNHL